MRRFRFLRNPLATGIGDDEEQFLQILGGPSCIYLDGDDSSRTRAFVTLLHGDEPSGTRALFQWLKSGRRPAVNAVCIVAAVSAALQPPLFSHRVLPGARDLNRCFRPPFTDEQGRLAEEMLEILHLHHPEAVVDMHDCSGDSPAFGLCTYRDRQHDALVSLFSERLVVSNLCLGGLMDVSEHTWPTVTVAVGRRGDAATRHLAEDGLASYLLAERVLAEAGDKHDLDVLANPVRLVLNAGVSLTCAERAVPDADVTLLPDIERHNFAVVEPGTPLGWARGDARRLFTALDSGGRCTVAQVVRIEDGVLYPARRLTLFMVAANPDIAQGDCLFYAAGA